MITGKDLIQMGYKPEKWFRDAIAKYNLANIEDEIIPYGCIMAGNTNHKTNA